MRIAAALAMIALAGCTPVEMRGGGTTCDAARVADLVDKPFTDSLGKGALRRAGARTLRHLPPGAMMTMDYRVDRLNVSTDAGGIVTKVNCG